VNVGNGWKAGVAVITIGSRCYVTKTIRKWERSPMKMLKAACCGIALAVALAARHAQAAGFRMIEVPADVDHPEISGAIWYPCSEPPIDIELKGITIKGTPDCPITGEHLPLIVMSHGSLGAYFDHHDTAAALADAGFVVAAISHRGDNVPTLADAADPSVMFERPMAIKRLIDFMVSTSPAAPHLDRKRIGFFGFSAGAVTGLELMGADPYWAVFLCRFSPAPRACASTVGRAFQARPHPVEPRIKAAVLADPPGIWLVPDSLSKVRTPIQLWQSAQGGRGLPNLTVTPESVAALEKRLTKPHEYHVVPNAWHFSFMLCGPSIKPVPEYCTDSPGFDRAAFHVQFNAEVVRFFRDQLLRRSS
jgi:predicted dienelactone hydrolase